ncbi:MAG: response regulator [Melioribacteraceae bacterium]|nr:response regulator [Melioribacteraceae bacterium]
MSDILIVDDEQVIIDSIIKISKMDDFTAIGVTNVQDALKLLEEEKFLIIISDIMMPDLDGFAFLQKLEEKGIRIPVIMTTGYSTVENAVQSLYQGAIGFIPKPFTIDEMESLIHRSIKFAKISRLEAFSTNKIVYVPCPGKYLRLGYNSWVLPEDDGSALIGLTDHLIKTTENTTSIELLNVDEELLQGNVCVKINTDDDLMHSILSPLSGRIIQRNERLLEEPSLIEKDPYFGGWLYRIIPNEFEYETKHLIPCSSDRN